MTVSPREIADGAIRLEAVATGLAYTAFALSRLRVYVFCTRCYAVHGSPCVPSSGALRLATTANLPSPAESTAMMDGSNRAEFPDVEVLHANDLIFMCRVGGKVVGIPPRRMLPGTTLVPQAGARGRLVVSHELALNLGLL